MNHYEVIIVTKSGQPARKGVVAANAVEAIAKAVASVDGAKAEDVERVLRLGVVDVF